MVGLRTCHKSSHIQRLDEDAKQFKGLNVYPTSTLIKIEWFKEYISVPLLSHIVWGILPKNKYVPARVKASNTILVSHA